MRKLYLFLSALMATIGSTWAQPEKNSSLTSDAYLESPRLYLSKLSPSRFGTNLLIDRIITTESLADFNGTNKIKNVDYNTWMILYDAVRDAHNDSTYLSNFSKIDSLSELYQKYDNIYPIGILNMEYSKLSANRINNPNVSPYFKEVGGKLVEMTWGRTPAIALTCDINNLMAASVLAGVVSGSTVKFLIPDVLEFRTNKKMDGQKISLQADFGDGNGLRNVSFDQVVEINYGRYSGYKNLKIKLTATATRYSTSQILVSNSSFFFKGSAAVPIPSNLRLAADGTAGGAGVKEFNTEILFPAANYIGWKKKPFYCSNTKLAVCWEEQLEETPKIECHIYFEPLNKSGKLRRPFIIVDGFDYGNKRDYLRTNIIADPQMPKDNDARGLFELLNGNPSPWYPNNQSPQLIKSLQDRGYDIVLINWLDGTGDIPANGEMLRRFIKDKLNGSALRDALTEEMILVGPSMGGLITRYALTTMEKAGEPHNVKTWISFDSPHQGAYISLPLQHTMNFFKDINDGKGVVYARPLTAGIFGSIATGLLGGDPLLGTLAGVYISGVANQTIQTSLSVAKQTFQSAVNALNSPAARQLLLQHFSVIDRPTEDFNQFYAKMNSLGYPQATKNYGITNGGTQKQFEHNGLYKQNISFQTANIPWMNSEGQIQFNRDGDFQIVKMNRRDIKDFEIRTENQIGYDNAIGGFHSALYSLNCNPSNKFRKSDTQKEFTRYCFISTASAFGQKPARDNVYKDWKQYQSSNTPFDKIRGADGESEEHVTISADLSKYLLENLDEDFTSMTRPTARDNKPTNLKLDNVALRATQTIVLAGNGNTVDVTKRVIRTTTSFPIPRFSVIDVPSNATIAAGHSVTLLPGFTASEGSDVTISIAKPTYGTSALRRSVDKPAFEVIDYNQPNPYAGQIWDYSDPKNPKLLNGTDDNTENIQTVSILPNPTTDRVKITLNGFAPGLIKYELINGRGEVVIKETLLDNSSFWIDIQHHTAGLYVLKLTQADKIHIQKIIKL